MAVGLHGGTSREDGFALGIRLHSRLSDEKTVDCLARTHDEGETVEMHPSERNVAFGIECTVLHLHDRGVDSLRGRIVSRALARPQNGSNVAGSCCIVVAAACLEPVEEGLEIHSGRVQSMCCARLDA